MIVRYKNAIYHFSQCKDVIQCAICIISKAKVVKQNAEAVIKNAKLPVDAV